MKGLRRPAIRQTHASRQGVYWRLADQTVDSNRGWVADAKAEEEKEAVITAPLFRRGGIPQLTTLWSAQKLARRTTESAQEAP
jgi:hypothetical protein